MLNSKIWKLIVLLALFSLAAFAQEAGQQTFATPSEAAQALYNAAKADDSAAIEAVLGPSSKSIISSGDAVQDKEARETFVTSYEQMNRIAKAIDGTRILYIGANNYPFAISLKEANGKWYFDTPDGKQEILFRRIGKNEFAAMRVMDALADAQLDYRSHFGQFADKFVSSEGKQDGLYWKAVEGQPESPVGPLVAYATAEGYNKSDPESVQQEPFHGYFFHLLKAQGANVKGGAKSYIVNGKMTRGFAFVAYPAEYRNSGVMTFLIDKNGILYEKDLGAKTEELAKAMTSFNPDKTWSKVPGSEGEADQQ
jgi:hypothetical protein